MKPFAALILSLAILSAAAGEEEGMFRGAYAGVSGAIVLPQGGSRIDRAGGGLVRAGAYLSDVWAFEASAGQLERYTALGAGLLVHFSALELYDRFFGYSAFDPFLTAGAYGLLDGRRGQVGPSAGLGAFWHLDDNWSVRVDAAATLGLDTDAEMLYTVSVGIQYTL